MRKLLPIAIMFFMAFNAWTQVIIDRVLIGVAGHDFSNVNISLSASAGEPVIATSLNSGFVLTQGFQQPNYVLSNPLFVELQATNAACLGANDGTVTIAFQSDNFLLPVTYQWSNGSTADKIVQAEVGEYTLTVTGSDGNAAIASISVEAEANFDCTPGFYIGITPNNDNFNDYWHIDNAEFFIEKSVEVYNRYGALVWENTAYDNLDNSARFTGLHRNGNPLPDGTYYFLAKFDNSTYKGWIEISR
ncbi:MAG: gliding motility-associated C-terminal domain-containing protein [Cryomorphaceae bacterium]